MVWKSVEQGREYDRAYREANRERLAAQKRAYYHAHKTKVRLIQGGARARLNGIKMERGCEYVRDDGSICGWREHPAGLEFDHRDPAGKCFELSNATGRSWTSISVELAKCDVLCSNHHRMRTVLEKHNTLRKVNGKAPSPIDSQMRLSGGDGYGRAMTTPLEPAVPVEPADPDEPRDPDEDDERERERRPQ